MAKPRAARLAISTALAGSLLYIGGFESGGVHYSGVSGTGKNSIIMFALSVDGDPSNPGPCVLMWDSTPVGFEIGLSYRNDACAVIDEIGKASDLQIGDKVYLLAGGKGRERGNKDITLREVLMWRVSIVSTGEFALENKMAEIEAGVRKRARGGQVSRILDLEARGVAKSELVKGRLVETMRKDPFDGEAIDSVALVESIKEQARDNYGVARPAFVQALLDNEVNYPFLRERVAEFVTKHKPEKAHSQIQRTAERFGVIPDVIDAHWETAVRGLRAFIASGHGAEAERLGWPKSELYRVPKLWSRIWLCGAGLLIGDATVTGITATEIKIRTVGGGDQTFRRKPEPDLRLVYSEQLKLRRCEDAAGNEEAKLRALEFTINFHRDRSGVDSETAKQAVTDALKATP
jgi:Domain of unknown function (DUF927)